MYNGTHRIKNQSKKEKNHGLYYPRNEKRAGTWY